MPAVRAKTAASIQIVLATRIRRFYSEWEVSGKRRCHSKKGNKLLDSTKEEVQDQGDDDPSWWSDEDWLMAIDLGYDESGSGDTLLVSMQLAITEQAKKLKRQWKKRLKESGVDYFHSVEFDNMSHGVFAGLTRIERGELLHDLSRLIHQHVTIGITAKITKSVYDQKTTQVFRSRWGTAYTFTIQMLVSCAYIYAKRFSLRPDFNILIEDGHRHAGQAIQSLHHTKKAGLTYAIPSRVLNVGLGSKVDHPILQAADMLAYSVWQMRSDGDLTIYDAMHPEVSLYRPESIDFDVDLVDVVKNGADKWLADRKEWGQRKARENEQSQ
jgi:hypothetical protein